MLNIDTGKMDKFILNEKVVLNPITIKRTYGLLRKHAYKKNSKTPYTKRSKYVMPLTDALLKRDANAKLDAFQAELSNLRVDLQKSHAHAIYDESEDAVYLVNEISSLSQSGYRKNGKHYLYYYEALVLMELKRLQINYCGLSMSLEQAFVFLIGEERDNKADCFFIYSHLIRQGYNVLHFQNISYNEENSTLSMIDCCWQIALHHSNRKLISDSLRTCINFEKAMASMQLHQQQLLGVTELPPEFESKANESGVMCLQSQNNCTQGELPSLVLINAFEDFPNAFSEFQHMFVSTETAIVTDIGEMEKLHIAFDLYLPQQKAMQVCHKTPVLRVVVLRNNARFPSIPEIKYCYLQQLYKVPLALIHFSKSKQLQCFLYCFS